MVICGKCNAAYANFWWDDDPKSSQADGCSAEVCRNVHQGHGELDDSPSFKTIPQNDYYIQCYYGSEYDMCTFAFSDEEVGKALFGVDICDRCIETLEKEGKIKCVKSL